MGFGGNQINRKVKDNPLMSIQEIHGNLQLLADPLRAQVSQRFFKTGPGQYGEGDLFLGIRVPEIRKLVKKYQILPLQEIIALLQSPIHEARLLALLLLVHGYMRGDAPIKEQIYHLYLENSRFINNWDLVDASAEHIVGAHLRHHSKLPLYILAMSSSLWERRIAILATFHYIKHEEFSETLQIAGMLLKDPEDLIHKAVGWMLREIGKRDHATEEMFLRAHYKSMPRTMLRYAIERFPEEQRQQYLKGTA
jgi:3-methyladenine DNA glycosylase AlkD